MGPRARVALVSAISLAALVTVALLLPVPYVKLAPGPTFNVIGEADGEPFLSITGTTTYPVSGNLDMTTVRESGGPRGGLTFVEAIGAWFSTADAVVPRELIYTSTSRCDSCESWIICRNICCRISDFPKSYRC